MNYMINPQTQNTNATDTKKKELKETFGRTTNEFYSFSVK